MDEKLPLSAAEERALIEARAEVEAQELMTIPSGSAQKPLSVGQLNGLIQDCLAATIPATVYVLGEISNFRTYDRGHAFFTLKEPGAELPCVLWKDALARLKFRPRDGLAVIARGTVKLYEPQGKLQLYVETLLPQGAGGLELAFRQLCEKLRAEGLFETARKKPIPKFPQRIVIITSRTGDVLHDVLTTAHRRYPGLHILLFPVRVQGEQAAPEIIAAILAVNRHHEAVRKSNGVSESRSLGDPANPDIPIPRHADTAPPGVDLILLVRGGGSLEDLWAFNDEGLARAIVASKIPIATGIGHEPDTTIADLVGDLRGPTPTGVTELTIPDVRNLRGELDSRAALLTRDLRRTAELAASNLRSLSAELQTSGQTMRRERMQHLDQLAPLIERIEPRHAIAQGWRRVEESHRNLADAASAAVRHRRERLNQLQTRLEKSSPLPQLQRQRDRTTHLLTKLQSAAAGRTTASAHRLSALAAQLRVVSPQAVLDRGYSITTNAEGRIIRSTAEVKKGDLLQTRVADGTIDSTVGKPKQGSLF